MTETPWPAGTAPTAAQLLEWLTEGPMQDPEDAIIYLDGLLRAAEQAHRCIVMDHDHGMRELTRATLDASRWRVLVDEVRARRQTHPLDPTARRVRELMGEDHRE